MLLGSCPQLLDVTLRTAQHPVDVKRVGVGTHLGCDPCDQPYECGGQGLPDPEGPLEARKGNLYLLANPRSSRAGLVGNHHDPQLSQLLLKFLAFVGKIPQQLPRYLASEISLGYQLFCQGQRSAVFAGVSS